VFTHPGSCCLSSATWLSGFARALCLCSALSSFIWSLSLPMSSEHVKPITHCDAPVAEGTTPVGGFQSPERCVSVSASRRMPSPART
jgi:hypothetical protein